MSNGLYSKATRGLRQSDIIKDQQFKLVFVYPMLVDNTLGKYKDLLRNFLTTTMLKELFISNALNLVNITSQIHPLTDEKGKPVDIHSSISTASLVSGGSTEQLSGTYAGTKISGQVMAHPLEHMKHELASRIREKTAIIRKYLASDPTLRALNPYVEMITMDNLVDVPVIIGTKPYDVDSAVMQFVFLVSIAEKLSLKDGNNIEKIFDKIEKTDQTDAWTLLNNLVPKDKKEVKRRGRIREWFNNIKPVRKWSAMRARRAETRKKEEEIRKLREKFYWEQEFDQDESFQLLQVVQSNVAQTKLFFKFCYDRNLLKSKFGIDLSQGQISTRVAKVSGQIQSVFNTLYSNFVSSLTRMGNPVILSLINILYPTESGVDEIKIVDDYIFSRMLTSIRTFVFRDLMVKINEAIESGGIESSDAKIKELKDLCVSEFRDTDGVYMSNSKDMMDNQVSSPVSSFNEMSRFMGVLSKVGTRSIGQSRDIQHALDTILGGETDKVLGGIQSIIITELAAMLDELARSYNRIDFNNVAFFRAVEADPNAPEFEFNQRLITALKSQLVGAAAPYIYFLFMYQLQIALCNYVSIVDVEVEAAKNDVLDHPNYTLVVPIQTIESIANALVAKSWKQLIQTTGGRGFIGAVGDSYFKGVIKFMKRRLGVPNLIVVDEQKGEIFYQLMHQSEPQKTKLRTLETFIKLTGKEELQGELPGSAFPSGYY